MIRGLELAGRQGLKAYSLGELCEYMVGSPRAGTLAWEFFDFWAGKQDDGQEITGEEFMRYLRLRVEEIGGNADTLFIALESASKELLACLEEREHNNWINKSSDATPEENAALEAGNGAWNKALNVVVGIVKALHDGNDPLKSVELSRISTAINSTKIEGLEFHAKVWQNYGKARIYVDVKSTDGQSISLYVEHGKVFWKSQPKQMPDWADVAISAIKENA